MVNTPSTDNLTISDRITVTGTANLILCDGAKLTASAGITTTYAILNIYAQSTGDSMGQLIATGGNSSAGIGGNGASQSGGTLTINGGEVTATGGNGASGIGGGYEGSGGTITINGGEVTATGGDYAAGIGGGLYGASGAITITGGTVTANGNVGGKSDDGGAGIGGGENGDNSGTGNSITITDENSIQGNAAVSYYAANEDGTDKSGEALTGAPTDVGRYWAEITLGTDDHTATAHVVYEITLGNDTTATLTVDGGGGTAALLDDSYSEVNSLTKKAGEQFILRVIPEDDYDYAVKFGSDVAAMTEFTAEEYEAYLAHAQANDIAVSPNTVLGWVTMPASADDSVTAAVSF